MTTQDNLKVSILIVDDNDADLAMAKFLISREGWIPLVFNNQIKAVQSIKELDPTLILLDIDMPGLSGMEVLKRLKREMHTKAIPVVMLSGHSDLENVKKAINLGAADYIIKPIDPQIFTAKIAKHLPKVNALSAGAATEWVEYNIPTNEQPLVKLFLDAKLISFGEVSFRIRCQYTLPLGATLLLDFAELKELDMGPIPVRIIDTKDIADGLFEIQCNIVGLGEKDLQKIRVFCKSLWRENRSKL